MTEAGCHGSIILERISFSYFHGTQYVMKYVKDELNIKIDPRMNNAGRKSEHVATFRLVGSFEPPWLRLSRLIRSSMSLGFFLSVYP